MGIIGKHDGDIENRNKKKQQHTNTHEKKIGDRDGTEKGLHTSHSQAPGRSRAIAHWNEFLTLWSLTHNSKSTCAIIKNFIALAS
jgi:hypothetical protein